MTITSSPVMSYSDTDSDGEPNTTDANIFWGNLKTPEKSRTINDLPQTILLQRSTFQTLPYDSPSKPLTKKYHQEAAIGYEEGIENPQITPVRTSIQTGGVTSRAPSPTNSATESTVPTSMHSPIRNEITERPNTVSDNNNIEHNLPFPALDMFCPGNNLPVVAEEDCLNTTPVQSRKEYPVPSFATSSTKSATQPSYPVSQLNTDIFTRSKTPTKVVDIQNEQSTPLACHPIFLGTPGGRDISARKERRMKWKCDESQGRHPLLSLSPTSTSILNLVQSPDRESYDGIAITSSPARKAQRVPARSLLHQSPMKPLRLGFPSSVNLNDPNRIPARRIPNPQSPLRSIRTFIHTPARRVPVINSDKSGITPTVPTMSERTLDVSALPFSTDLGLTSSQSCELPTAGHLGDMLGSSATDSSSLKTPHKITSIARNINMARQGLSRLPVPSSRSGRPPPSSLLSIQKKFDRVATTPSRIPSPLKRNTEDHRVSGFAETQIQHLQSGSKRKRTDDTSEDDVNERPQKRIIVGVDSVIPQNVDSLSLSSSKPSIQESRERSQDSDNPFVMSVDNSPVQSPVEKQTFDRKNTEHFDIPLVSTSSISNPRRTSRGRKRTVTPLSDKSQLSTHTVTQSLPSRKSPVTKSLSKLPSRPSGKTATRGGNNLSIYPENPRELQMVTSANTRHNQECLAELERRVIRRAGNRPPSPSNRFRVDVDNKNREEREARAERRRRRDKDHHTVIFDEIVALSSEPTNQNKHRQAPGDDEDYHTPIKDPIPSKFHPDKMTKTVKWSRNLIDITSRPHTLGQSDASKPKSKSCLLRDPKTLSLNFLGNVPNAQEPLSELVKEHLVVSKFLYDDDIQESPGRSKKKVAMKI